MLLSLLPLILDLDIFWTPHPSAGTSPSPPPSCLLVRMQVKAGMERVREVLLGEDPSTVLAMPQDAFSYVDVMPEMVGYVLGSR